jgi:hypothetical protein
MNLRQIVAISGLPGLFQLLTTKSDGAIVRSIEEGTTRFVGARQHNVSALEGIEVYTNNENMRIGEVFLTMKENSAKVPALDMSKSDNKAITEHFGQLFPDYDKERVYASDMKKMVKWFYILNGKDLLNAEEETTEEAPEAVAATAEAPTAEVATEAAAVKPAKKAATKKAKEAAPTAEGDATEAKEVKKKAAPKAKKAKADEGDATDK